MIACTTNLFLLKRAIDRPTVVLHTFVFGRHFLENEHDEPITFRKTTAVFIAKQNI